MAGTTLHYEFPWRPLGTAAGDESFALLDGAIRGSVRHNPNANPEARYAALIDPAFFLGEFASADEARAAVEAHTTQRINAMLAVILPGDVQKWLKQPL